MSDQSGLTLIELLLAVAILAVITVGCYTVTQQFVTADEQLRGRLQELQGLQRSIQIIGRDLGQVFPRSVQSFQDRKPAMLGTGDAIEFTRGGYLVPDFVNRPSSELARVRYYVNSDAQLIRAVWRLVDRPNDEPDGEAVVLRGVEVLEWSYIPQVGTNLGGQTRQTLDQWPADDYQGGGGDESDGARRLAVLPWGVSLTIETQTWGELNWQWEMPNFRGAVVGSAQSGEQDLGFAYEDEYEGDEGEDEDSETLGDLE